MGISGNGLALDQRADGLWREASWIEARALQGLLGEIGAWALFVGD